MALPNILGKEFDCINKIIKTLPVGGLIGDDCAVIKCGKTNLLISVDTFVENVHFDLKYFKLQEVGQRCCDAALSDIAAMAGKALYTTLSISVPDYKMISSITLGVKRSLKKHKVVLIGGDTTYSEKIVVSLTVIGESDCPIYRKGATPGDNIYISSYTGLSEGGFYVLKNKIKGFKILAQKHKKPTARLDLSSKLLKVANSMIDISDGLVSELYHIAHASGVSIVVDNVPIHPELKRLQTKTKIDSKVLAFYGGEEFELLYTVPKNKKPVGLKIGTVIKSKGKSLVYFKDRNGMLTILPANKGFKHF